MLAIRDIITSVRHLLSDRGADRWDDEQLFLWINEAHTQLISDAPSLCKERGVIPTTGAAVQELPEALFRLIFVYGICDSSGVVSALLTEARDTDLFNENPAWMGMSPDVPVHWAQNTADFTSYYLYPVPEDPGYLLADYISVPVRPTNAESGQLDMFDHTLLPVFVDYVLYRAFGVDSDNTENMALSKDYLLSYITKTGAVIAPEGVAKMDKNMRAMRGGSK